MKLKPYTILLGLVATFVFLGYFSIHQASNYGVALENTPQQVNRVFSDTVTAKHSDGTPITYTVKYRIDGKLSQSNFVSLKSNIRYTLQMLASNSTEFDDKTVLDEFKKSLNTLSAMMGVNLTWISVVYY